MTGERVSWYLCTRAKGDPLVCGSYRTINLLEQPMKMLESVEKEDQMSGVN